MLFQQTNIRQLECETGPIQVAVYYILCGMTFIFFVNQVNCEIKQYFASEEGLDYFKDLYNVNDQAYLILNFLVLLMTLNGDNGFVNRNLQRTLAAISSFLLWVKVIDWLRLFQNTAFYVHLIKETVIDMKSFMVVILVWFMAFGTSFYLLTSNRNDNQVHQVSNFWVINAFEKQYEWAVGEFMVEGLDTDGESQTLFVYFFFIASTFSMQIIFFNMLIAIMGDTFSKVNDDQDNYARQTKLNIMADYTALINPYDKEDEILKQNEIKADVKLDLFRNSLNESTVSTGSADKGDKVITSAVVKDKSNKPMPLLYSVTIDDDGNYDKGVWDG